jgi:nicotinate-nucleotide adenylyltransferase
LKARLRSAERMSRRAPIIPSAIELDLDTRYTVDTLAKLVRRYPRRRFVWLMGADNLAQFHLWKGWRRIARTMPIAVIARPGYDAAAMTSPAMAWLRRYRLSAASFRKRGQWSAPALVLLRFDPDHRSATAIRRAHAGWAEEILGQASKGEHHDAPVRDRLTFRSIRSWEDA